jgi:ubiquinone/menaquinone biosynthesis C-methylase UbiE
MKRDVQPELLDQLPAGDHHAVHSRRDLQKINAWMGHARLMGRMLAAAPSRPPQSIVELGSGDGTLLLKLARRFAPQWKPSRVVLVDRQPVVSPATTAAFASLSWPIEFAQMDVFEWLERSRPASTDVTLTTLFLHHFVEQDLGRLLQRVAAQTRLFIACEPRRSQPVDPRWRLVERQAGPFTHCFFAERTGA